MTFLLLFLYFTMSIIQNKQLEKNIEDFIYYDSELSNPENNDG
jgi:hypothetical protein